LTELEVRGHDTDDHVVNAGLVDSAVVDSKSDVSAKVRRSAKVLAVRTKTSGHVHVETSLNRGNAGMGSTPVRHNVSLETELSLEQTVLGSGVLASVRSVDPLVGAHEAGSAGLDGVGERPHVELVHGTVVNVGRDGSLVLLGGVVRPVGRVTHGLLLIAHPVLRTSLHTCVLGSLNGLLHSHSAKVWV